MADPERMRESKRRYDARKPTVGVRLPGTVAEAVLTASTAEGVTRAEWIREAVEQRLAREQNPQE